MEDIKRDEDKPAATRATIQVAADEAATQHGQAENQARQAEAGQEQPRASKARRFRSRISGT